MAFGKIAGKFNGISSDDFGLVGQSSISDGAGVTSYEDSVLIYNENFGTFDTTTEWAETNLGGGTQTHTGGVLKLVQMQEVNNSLSVNVTGKTKKIRVIFNSQYLANNGDDSYFGMSSQTDGGSYAIYFMKGLGADDNWTGYVMDENSDEYETAAFSVSKSIYHNFEIRFNSNRTDFLVDGVNKGTINGNIPVNTNMKVFLRMQGAAKEHDFNWIRLWEITIPK